MSAMNSMGNDRRKANRTNIFLSVGISALVFVETSNSAALQLGIESLPSRLVRHPARWRKEPAQVRMGTERGDGISGVFGSGGAHMG